MTTSSGGSSRRTSQERSKMRKRRTTGVFPSVQGNGSPTTRVVPRQQQPGTGTSTTNTPPPPDLNRRTDMWTDTDSLSDSDDESTIIRSPLPPQTGGVQQQPQQTTTTTTTTMISAPDAHVNRLRAFLDQHQGPPPSPEMEAALRKMQAVADAHRDGSLTDNALQRALTTLRIIEVTGAPTVPLTVAQPPAPQFGVMLDGAWVTELSQSQLIQLTNARRGNLPDTAALGYILADGQFNGSMADLAKLLDGVEQRIMMLWANQALDDTPASRIARLVNDADQEQKQLAATLGTEVKEVSGAQCRAMRELTNRLPNLFGNLRPRYVTGFVFGSRKAVGQGAGVFDSPSGQVHMASMGDKAPESFVRLFIHETGHASLQRELVGGVPPSYLEKSEYAAKLQRKADLLAALDQQQLTAKRDLRRQKFAGGKVDATTTAMVKELQTIETELDECDKAWQAMSDDAKTLYRAWQKLRENNGMYLIGIDMGRATNSQSFTPADRQKYQADGFSEFCAESFMHLAMGDLDKHVLLLHTKDSVPDDVTQAWANAQRILHQYGDPILG